MLRRLGLVVVTLVLLGSAREAFAWPSPANWGCGWYGSVRPAHCNVGWGCGPSFCGPSFCGPGFCGPRWGWCGPRFYGVAGWSVGGLNFTYQGFAPAWGVWAPGPAVPFFVQQPRRNLLIAARPAAAGHVFAQRAAPAPVLPQDLSSAARPAESIAALRAARQAEAGLQLADAASDEQPANPLVDDLVARADKASAAGKIGAARLYLQMAFEESAGARREAVRAKLAKLDEPPAKPARVAGGEGAAVH
jgi:hypothetical protein